MILQPFLNRFSSNKVYSAIRIICSFKFYTQFSISSRKMKFVQRPLYQDWATLLNVPWNPNASCLQLLCINVFINYLLIIWPTLCFVYFIFKKETIIQSKNPPVISPVNHWSANRIWTKDILTKEHAHIWHSNCRININNNYDNNNNCF